jgi:GNAT superfamily N-acetyltransferase
VADRVTFAWLCDVFVAPEARGLGLGEAIAAAVVDDLEPLGLKRILLSTGDAYGLTRNTGLPPGRSVQDDGPRPLAIRLRNVLRSHVRPEHRARCL